MFKFTMIKNLSYHLKRSFIIQRFSVQTKCNNLLQSSSISKCNFELTLENPVLALLIQGFERYGYVKVSSLSKDMPHELNNIIEYVKDKPLNVQNGPSFLHHCQTYEEIIGVLRDIYCNDVGAEYHHLFSFEEKDWFSNRFSSRDEYYNINTNMKIEYLKLLNRSEQFDIFLGKKFQSVKRYSGEGIESALICMLEIFKRASSFNISNVIISMAHRSRNNLLTTLLKYPPVLYFRKMLGLSEFPSEIQFPTGDVFSHFFHSMDFINENEITVHVSLIPNPSHLEANIPVGAGKVRSKMLTNLEGDYCADKTSRNGDTVLGVFVHGDASIYGQGIVPETLVMTDSSNFSIGGGVHIVLNNQLGFTTATPNGFKNVTDIGKVVNCPVIHVNAHSVIEVAKAAMLAMDYRNIFRKDIFINIMGYRKWGHNELDDPTITQPLMYSKLSTSKTIVEDFSTFLLNEKCNYSQDEITNDTNAWIDHLNNDLKLANEYEPQLLTFKRQWADQKILDSNHKSLGIYNTGVCIDKLKEIGKCSVYIPPNFKVHSNVFRTHIQKRMDKLESKEIGNIDWATAEALAIGSLLFEGVNCRISGQDVGRGTFSHRHLSLINQETDERCISFNSCPLPNHFSKRGYLEIANSILSEEAVLGFEIGMSLDNPNNLIIWEAQFGDFFNGAQILIDTYLGSSETKWMLQNGLILLLPHGYDGGGPEHSSCRLERFLQLTDSSEIECDSDRVNMHIINPTTPAQYFHALRRQIIRPFRRPLIVASPKVLLRSALAVSSLIDFQDGTNFNHVLSDSRKLDFDKVDTILLCSGKHYYTLLLYLESLASENQNKFAILRIEQLVPFPINELSQEIKKFSKASKFVWCQEEHRNMGAWQFVNARIENLIGIKLKYAGRKELAAPAVGIGNVHKKELENLLKLTFE